VRTHFAWLLTVVVVGAAVYAGTVLATPPSSVKGTVFGIGNFGPIDTKGTIGSWSATMKTTKRSDIHVLSNRIAPGGSFGWHSHPGPSFVIIKSGTATVYMGADPTCTPRRFSAGSGFVDRGLDVHIVRNEGLTDLVTVVVSFVPKGAERRIDEANPGSCPFSG
jgi:mannose-6-phosphate isomerase-like protein (cupin superfamily)